MAVNKQSIIIKISCLLSKPINIINQPFINFKGGFLRIFYSLKNKESEGLFIRLLASVIKIIDKL